MNVGVDVGYGFVKAVKRDEKCEEKKLFPSCTAPARELVLEDLSQNGNGPGHFTQVRFLKGGAAKYFVGELALREGRIVSFTLDREKHLHPSHDVLLLTAVSLLLNNSHNRPEPVNLAVGLPIRYYRKQKDVLSQHLKKLAASVSVNGSEPVWLSFNKVLVYPQGAGALLTVNKKELPQSGYIALIDVGFKTTDYLIAEIQCGSIQPVSGLSGSIEIGTHHVSESVSAEFSAITGGVIDPIRVPSVFHEGKTYYRGREINLTSFISKVRHETARTIADRLLAVWGDRADYVRKVYLAGGGVQELEDLETLLPAAEILPEYQFANAIGYLKAICSLT